MKQINYVIIAEGLTGDSEVLFFNTPEQAEQKFKDLTEPLLAVCRAESLEEGDTFYNDENGKGWRFNNGENDMLDELLNDTNRYIKWDSISVMDVYTMYVAEFSEHVDDSNIMYFTNADAHSFYSDRINEGIAIAKDHKNIIIDRYNTETWTDNENNTMFQETVGKPYLEAFFGYDIDCYYTYRLGAIGENSPVTQPPVELKVYIAYQPNKEDFSLTMSAEDDAVVLGVFYTEQNALDRVREALKAADMDEDDNDPVMYVGTHIVE